MPQLMRRKPQGKGRGRGGAPTTKLEPVDSFFRFFSPPKVLLQLGLCHCHCASHWASHSLVTSIWTTPPGRVHL